MSDDEHGISGGFYSNGPDGLTPVLECLCGFETSRYCSTWQEAGDELDAHLGAVAAVPAEKK